MFDIVFNGAMLVSALILTFMVLAREAQFASSQPPFANQSTQQRLMDATGEGRFSAP